MQNFAFDYKSIRPKVIPINTIEEQNDFTFVLKNNNYNISISAPGYNQKEPIALLVFDVDNSFINIHYTSNEMKKNLIILPKFGKFPIKLQLFPYQNMNYKLFYKPIYFINQQSAITLPLAINSFKSKFNLSPSIQLISDDLFFSFSLFGGFPFHFGLAWTLGRKSFLVGLQYHKKIAKEYFESVFQYKNSKYEISLLPRINQMAQFEYLKGSLVYNSKYNVLMSFKAKKIDEFQLTSQLKYSNKSFEVQLAPKKLRCTLGSEINSRVSAKIGLTFGPFFGHQDPPSIKASLIFNDQ